MFKAEIIGNLGADAEIKEYQGGKFVAFRVAHTIRFKNQQGQETDSTTWIDCTMNNVESKIIPFLKAGTKVFVRGNANLRVYSSPKLRQMMAGLTISVGEIELCGGASDNVPRQLINPDGGAVFNVQKFYWCDAPTQGMKDDEYIPLIDKQGHEYMMNCGGFVQPIKVLDGDTEDQGAIIVQAEKLKEEESTKVADGKKSGGKKTKK